MDEYRRITQNQINKLENMLKQYNQYMKQKDSIQYQNNILKNTLDQQRNDKIKKLADLQKDKIQATNKLKDQMINKIRDMRHNLLSLKKQQLSTTTRLAVLQNHQLTNQLQFQSKESQRMILQNQHLKKKVVNLQKDLDIHREIEDELAKRAHYSRNIIKKLTNKISDLEDKIKIQQQNQIKKQMQYKESKQLKIIQVQKRQNKEQNIHNEKLKLSKSVQTLQKQIIELQNELNQKIKQNNENKTKLKLYQISKYNIVILLQRYYNQILQNHKPQQNYQYNLKKLRQTTIQEWNKNQISFITICLLKLISQHLQYKNLKLPQVKDYHLVDYDDFIHFKLPSLSQSHSANKNIIHTPIPINLRPKLVRSNVRQWGKMVPNPNSISNSNLNRKYKIISK